MKKLNRKGFTLVELLAVIIILAIVVGISIPAITNIINDSKNNSLGVAVDAAEKFLYDQYSFMQLSAENVHDDFDAWVASATAAGGTVPKYDSTNGTYTETLKSSDDTDKKLIEAMGFNSEDITEVEVTVFEKGGACVKVTKIPTSSQYYSTEYWSSTGAKTDAENTSKGC